MQKKRQLIQFIIFVIDLITISFAYVLAYRIRFYFLSDGIVGGDYFMLYMVVVVLYALIYYTGVDQDGDLSRSLRQDIQRLFHHHIYMGLFLFAFLFVMKSGVEYSRLQIFLFLVVSLFFTVCMRRFVRREMKNRFRDSDAVEHIVLTGTCSGILAMYDKIREQDLWYCRVTGVCSFDGHEEILQEHGLSVLAADEQKMYQVLSKEPIDSVMVSCNELASDRINAVIEKLCAMGITTHVQIQENDTLQNMRHYDEIGNIAVMSYQTAGYTFAMRFWRRMLDIMIGMLGEICYLILLLPVAVAIRASGRGPVLICYTRVGRNGRRFHAYGFRTITRPMYDTESSEIGKFLVWSGLQCLPMTGCLLRGDMTLFGHQAPSLPDFMNYTPEQRRLMSRKPGFFQSVIRGREFDPEEQCIVCDRWERERENLFAGGDMIPIWLDCPARKTKYHAFKRFLDIVISLIAIVLLSPVWILLALIIFLHDGHNPIYTQIRVGQYGFKIPIYKFRSMSYHSDDLERLLTPEQLAQYKKEFKLEDDPRVTRIGKWLRRSSLDELPQLFNVLKGDISLVGPRPIVAGETYMYGDKILELLSVRPGLTGYWQACARNHATYASGERQKMELYYVKHESFWFDIRLIFRTIGRVISGDGAM